MPDGDRVASGRKVPYFARSDLTDGSHQSSVNSPQPLITDY
jgi:hypothetical protein